MVEHLFSPEDLERLASLLAEKVASKMPPHVCPFSAEKVAQLASLSDADRAEALRGIADRSITIRKIVTERVVDYLVNGAIVLLLIGLVAACRQKIMEWIGK